MRMKFQCARLTSAQSSVGRYIAHLSIFLILILIKAHIRALWKDLDII